ncbi:ThuA domain-containing protein, partial [Nonomuraea sp. NPDC049637]|uniref:ThuA domain-containing protein n=1 Tax=Nonomuraea sp. NPDC049637 TaxID=3154356 RepID=UPI003449743A
MSPRHRTWARLLHAAPPQDRRRPRRRIAAATALALVAPFITFSAAPASATVTASSAATEAAAAPDFKVLVFSKTTGFRHDAIPEGIAAVQKLGQDNNFAVDTTEDGAQFTDENLAQYQAVVFMSTTGDPLGTQEQKDAFQRYIQKGGGFVGVHAAADSGYNWAWYGKLVGAYFKQHPAIQQATVKVEDPAHPSTKDLPTTWTRTDEWYDYQANPRNTVHVLTSLEEKSYTGGTMGADHPNTWCQDFDGGRSWYTGLGHLKENYTEPNFLKLLLGGIQTAAGAIKADCSASQSSSFEKVTLDDSTSNPMMVDVAKDGRAFYIDRLGEVKIIKPTGGTVTAGKLNVFTANESGLLGLALDPGFDTNHWAYLYYSPSGENVDRLSRFTVNGDSLDLTSEKKLLDVPVQRAECCHHGGGMVMDPKTGNLWLATGDNTNPFASDGYAPLDEQSGRTNWDSQRTSANTNSLSGKLLRIHPEADGTYTVPSGNLFQPGTAKTKPEIYGMGFRNPFRMGLDPKTGGIMLGEYGPDANTASATRGPENTVEWNLVSKPGNYGWPYCVGNNTPYVDYDFATKKSGSPFNCAAPVNDSPNNDGLTNLPPVIPATIWYHYGADPQNFPELSGGAPMGGPVYRFDPNLQSDVKWPAYWDGKAVFGEWNNDNVWSFQLDENGTKLVEMNRILGSLKFKKPMDMKFGPDGALYMIEWGSGFGGDNADSGIYRIEYIKGNRPPIARVTADKTDGPLPLTVKFSSEGSRDPDDKAITYAWDLDGDGDTDSTDPNPTFTYDKAGEYGVVLTVTNSDGKTGTASVTITAGNTRPVVTVDVPPNGSFFEFGDQVKFKVTVTDAEDGAIDCDKVQIQAILGHDSHGHPLDQLKGCEGTLQTSQSGHGETDNLFYVIEASYADKGAGDAKPLTGRGQVILEPKRKQAEHFAQTGRVADGKGTDAAGVQTETTTDPQGGNLNIGFVQDGDWWSFDPVNLSNVTGIRFRIASGGAGGTVQVRAGNPGTGTLVGSAEVTPTGGWQTFTDVTLDLTSPPSESGPLYFVVRKPASAANDAYLANFNWVDFVGKGATDNQRPTVTATATPTTGTAPLKVDFKATATDPEGGSITYKWNFGADGSPQPATAEASYTYSAPGSYTAVVTATDDKGASATAQIPIKVDSATTVCLTGRSDGFTGDQLDRQRWSVIRENQDLKVAGGNLVIPTSSTDIYGTGGDATNIVVQPAPQGAWTATAKVTLKALDAYEQAGLVLYGDDDNYAKIVLEGRGTSDRAGRIFQYIREENGAPNEVNASNTANLGDAFPDTVYVRLVTDGTNLNASYSADGVTFTAMPETKKLAGITNPRIGLLALSGTGGHPVVDASFDWFQITPDDTATGAAPDDEFDGGALDSCRWNAVVRPDATGMRVTGGKLEIDTSKGDIYGSDNSGPKNFVLQNAPEGDWTLETKLDGSAFNQAYHQGGLVVYGGDDDYVKVDYVADGATATRIELRSEVGGAVQDPQPQVDQHGSGVWWLRLKKEGDTFHGYYSANGTDWTEIGATVKNGAVASRAKVGVFAFGGNSQTASATAKFDHFHLVKSGGGADDKTAPTTTAATDPAAPQSGWYTGPVSVTLSAADEADGSGVAKTEYQLDGGDWAAYTAPVVVSGDGSHALAYRSADKAGNVEDAKTLTVKADATAPMTKAEFASPNDSGWHDAAVPVMLTATDATAGVEKTEYAVDGGDWTPYTEPVTVSGEGRHELKYRSTDKAGNAEDVKAAAFQIDTKAPAVVISGVADGEKYGDSQDLQIAWQVVDTASGVKSVSGTLDGKPFESGTLQPLYGLALGTHTVTVTAVSNAGSQTEQSVTFSVETSTRDIAALIDRFEKDGKLTDREAHRLQTNLATVRDAEDKGKK